MSKLPTNESRASKSGGLLQEIHVSTLKLEDINMDFVVGFLRTQKQYDSIWVIVDSLTKSALFILDKSTYAAEDYARIFVEEIVCLHGIPLSTMSVRCAQSTSRFQRTFQKGLGTKVKLSTAFHPQMDGQVERTIQTREDMLRACIIDFKENRGKQLLLVEFDYNNSFHSFIHYHGSL